MDWARDPGEFRTTRRTWRLKVEGFHDGLIVASDVSDGPFGIGPLDLTEPKRGTEVPSGGALRLRWARHGTGARVAYTKVRHSLDGGRTGKSLRIAGNPGEYFWKAPVCRNRTEGCRVRVELYDATGTLLGRDAGQGPFTILGGVDLTALENGDSVYGGTSRTVRWTTYSKAAVAAVRLRSTLDGGATWSDLATVAGNPGHWHWQVPALSAAATSCRLEVTLLDVNGGAIATDRGEGFFTILLKGDAYATATPASIVVPTASATSVFEVSWGASPTPGATYELQEAVDPEFTADVRAAYAGPLLSAPITSRENGATYYYRVRALREGWNPSGWVRGGNGCAVSWDDMAPGLVTGFTATPLGDRVDLAWVNPSDSDLAGVRVMRRTDRAPAAPDDGTLVYEGRDQSFADAGLVPGNYFYAAFAYDAIPNFSSPATATAQVEPPTVEAPTAISVPASSTSRGCQVTWGASPTAGATYELEEATSPDFGTGLRRAYYGGWLSVYISVNANGTTYYYRVRGVRAGWNPSPWVAGSNGCAVSWDEVAPGPVTGFRALARGDDVYLFWVNPSDIDLAGVRVVRRTDRVPADPYDGDFVYVGGGQSVVDRELAPGTYYYAAFAYDSRPNFSPAATATIQVSAAPLCESCHNGDGDGDGVWTGVGYDPDGPGPLPAAPNVMGNGVTVDGVGAFPKPYDDGTYGYNVNGHGANGTAPQTPTDTFGRPYLTGNAECTDCHDIGIPPGTHLDGVLNSVELKQNANENTAHLNGTYIGAASPEWDVQVRFDDQCSFQCHPPGVRHRHTNDSTPAAGAVRFGDKGIDPTDGELISLPIDSALSTNASTAEPDFAPCIACHNPHGTDVVEWSKVTNRMLRHNWINPDPLCTSFCHRPYP